MNQGKESMAVRPPDRSRARQSNQGRLYDRVRQHRLAVRLPDPPGLPGRCRKHGFVVLFNISTDLFPLEHLDQLLQSRVVVPLLNGHNV